jgi:bifunctional non-homologous end joining protein LigD
MPETAIIEVGNRELKLSNLQKVLYPDAGFSKRQVIDYYIRVAPFVLPHLEGRPLTMKRYPDGVEAEFFYEKNAPKHRPDWVKTAPVWSEGNRRNMDFVMAQDLPTLVWLANLASLELHTSLSKAKDMLCPTMMVFDLDPGPPANIVQCCQVAFWLREIFVHFGLESFPKTSGSKGLQIYVPLNTPTSYEKTKPFAHALAQLLEHDHRDQVVSEMKKEKRGGKVFIDWSQNDDHKTTVCVYSLRAREKPTASTPVTWEEVERCWKKKDPKLLVFEAGQVLDRCEKYGDLFGNVEKLKQRLPDVKSSAAQLDIAAQAEPRPAAKPASKARSKRSANSRSRAKVKSGRL